MARALFTCMYDAKIISVLKRGRGIKCSTSLKAIVINSWFIPNLPKDRGEASELMHTARQAGKAVPVEAGNKMIEGRAASRGAEGGLGSESDDVRVQGPQKALGVRRIRVGGGSLKTRHEVRLGGDARDSVDVLLLRLDTQV